MRLSLSFLECPDLLFLGLSVKLQLMMDKPVFVDNQDDGKRRLINKLLAVSEMQFSLFLRSVMLLHIFIPFASVLSSELSVSYSIFFPLICIVQYFNFVQYPKQVDITPEQIQQNIEFSKIYKKHFEEEMRKMKAEQEAELAKLGSSNGEKNA